MPATIAMTMQSLIRRMSATIGDDIHGIVTGGGSTTATIIGEPALLGNNALQGAELTVIPASNPVQTSRIIGHSVTGGVATLTVGSGSTVWTPPVAGAGYEIHRLNGRGYNRQQYVNAINAGIDSMADLDFIDITDVSLAIERSGGAGAGVGVVGFWRDEYPMPAGFDWLWEVAFQSIRPVTRHGTGNLRDYHNFGDTSANTRIGEAFQVWQNTLVGYICVHLGNVGTPIDNLSCLVVTDNGGIPSLTPVTSGLSASISATTLQTRGRYAVFTFDPPMLLHPATTYHWTVLRSGAPDLSNFFRVGMDTTGAYGYGHASLYNGSAWSALTSNFIFSVSVVGQTWAPIAPANYRPPLITGGPIAFKQLPDEGIPIRLQGGAAIAEVAEETDVIPVAVDYIEKYALAYLAAGRAGRQLPDNYAQNMAAQTQGLGILPPRRRSLPANSTRIRGNTTAAAAASGGATVSFPPQQPGYLITQTGTIAAPYVLTNGQTQSTVTASAEIASLVNLAHGLLPTGGLIAVAAGSYNQSSVISLTNNAVSLIGSGSHNTNFVLNADIGADRFQIEVGTAGGVYTDVQDVHVKSLCVIGKQNDGTITHGGGIALYATNSSAEDVVVRQTNETGIRIAGGGGSSSAFINKLLGVEVLLFGRTGVYTAHGVHIGAGASDTVVDGFHIHCGGGGFASDFGGHGLFWEAGNGQMLNGHAYFNNGVNANPNLNLAGIKVTGGNLSITNVISESNNHHGWLISASHFGMMKGCQAYSNDISDPGADGSATNTTLRNVYFNNSGSWIVDDCNFTKQVATTKNIYRNMEIDSGCSNIEVSNSIFADAQDMHILIGGNESNIHHNQFLAGITYAGGINGRTPATACIYVNTGSNNAVNVNTVHGPTGAITSAAGSDHGQYFDNIMVAGTLVTGGTADVHRP